MGAESLKKQKNRMFLLPLIPVCLIGLFFVFRGNWLFSASVISKIIPSKNLPQSDGRTNILLTGVDKNERLTDSLMVVSIPQSPGKIVMVSLPRDLWVEYRTGASAKINEVYAYAGLETTGFNSEKGLTALKNSVTQATGMPVHYFAKVDFNGFKEAVDALGGIRITVQNTFDDYKYPVAGKEANTCGLTEDEILEGKDEDYVISEADYPCRFERLHFDKGMVQMNGESALKYARSRHSVNPAEGSDFARAERQQQVILAIKEKIMSLDTLFNAKKISELFAIYNKFVETDITLTDAEALFEVGMKSDTTNIKTSVLNNSNVTDGTGSGLLYTPTDIASYAGKWVLLPKGGSYSTVHAFIQKLLFDE
ncbi:LCP family protein [Candidatus Parcubacteria bacterium]|nr:LCP family protein [Patescibacteria group bacterium]MBU4381234.1 LCP family protein [Patescibacteria group bacterium]MCG2689266.1 LCP family protein [Candidatus Parcubacteria bacterium]